MTPPFHPLNLTARQSALLRAMGKTRTESFRGMSMPAPEVFAHRWAVFLKEHPDELDAGFDGVITEGEILKEVRRMFDKMDLNQDAKLSY